MSIAAIERILLTALTDMWPTLPMAEENIPFTYPQTGWMESNLLPAPPQEPTIGTTHLIYESGILQLLLYYPKDSGTTATRNQCDVIKDFFPRGKTMSMGSITVKIEKSPIIHPAMNATKNNVEWYVTPISIHYYSHIRS